MLITKKIVNQKLINKALPMKKPIYRLVLFLSLLATQNKCAEQPLKVQRGGEIHAVLQALYVLPVLSKLVAEYERDLMFMDVHQATPEAPEACGKILVEAFMNPKDIALSPVRDKYELRTRENRCRWTTIHIKEYHYTFPLQMNPHDTLEDIQSKLAESGIPPAEQLLSYKSRSVKSLADLSDVLSLGKAIIVHKNAQNAIYS